MGWLEVLERTELLGLHDCHHLGLTFFCENAERVEHVLKQRTSRYLHLSDFAILAEACNPSLYLLRLTLSKLDTRI